MQEVLILCTANSCRSQMAEGLINHDLKGQWKAYSAGFEPSFVNPRAIQVMAELGIDISHHTSKGLEAFAGKSFDRVITVCGDADEKCPVFPGKTQKFTWDFPIPLKLRVPKRRFALLSAPSGMRCAANLFLFFASFKGFFRN